MEFTKMQGSANDFVLVDARDVKRNWSELAKAICDRHLGVGHEVGEKLSFSVPPEEAFGPRHQELVIEKSKKDFHFPAGMEPYPGMELPLVTGDNNAPDTAIIREVREDSIVIDANHPLSGATLTFPSTFVTAKSPEVPSTRRSAAHRWRISSPSW